MSDKAGITTELTSSNPHGRWVSHCLCPLQALVSAEVAQSVLGIAALFKWSIATL